MARKCGPPSLPNGSPGNCWDMPATTSARDLGGPHSRAMTDWLGSEGLVMAYKVLLLPGDGIGPEVMVETRRVLAWFQQNRNLAFTIEEDLVGGIAYDTLGTPEPDGMIKKALAADAVLFGAVGGPKWDSLPFEKKPERGLLRLRKDLELFANLRPAICFDALKDASTLKPEIVS